MSKFNEHRKINYSRADFYCRYLSLGLPLVPRSKNNVGRFGAKLKELGISRFPYEIHPSEFVFLKILTPSLYVKLPETYFEEWENFPNLPCENNGSVDPLVGMYDLHVIWRAGDALGDLVHPYDGELKATFVEKYKSSIPSKPTIQRHSTGAQYIAAEGYLPYWHAYALADSYYLYRHIESLSLSKEDGYDQVINLVRPAVSNFCKKYAEVFDRVSWYKTIVTDANLGEYNSTNGEIFSLAQTHSDITIHALKSDLRLLLKLDFLWSGKINLHGCVVLKNARNELAKDIYFIYEQLRILNVTAESIFDEFGSRGSQFYLTPLDRVLGVEYFEFKDCFVTLGKIYSSQIEVFGYECSGSIFDCLIDVSGFDAWIRAFKDLHLSLDENNSISISFKQDRIVDALIVMSVRTEVVLREMFRPLTQDGSNGTIVDFLKAIKEKAQPEKIKVLENIRSQINGKTKLNKRPDELFLEISNYNPKNCSKEDLYFIQVVLKFITARNYFAHHAYKDDVLNNRLSLLALEVIRSNLATLLFFQKIFVIARGGLDD